jgi:hypothetical protein
VEADSRLEPEAPVSDPVAPASDPEPVRAPEPELEHPLGPVEPVATEPSTPEPPASSRKTPPAPVAEAGPRGSSGPPPPLHFENPPRRPRFSTEPPGLEPSELASPGNGSGPGREELARTSEFDVQEHLEAEQLEEDVLEETPEFLQDTPEHDRLWFEQRPPRDFDFDG